MVIASTRSSESISKNASVPSLDFSNGPFSGIEPRRTRKRITPSQLEQLEELYHKSSHPTREQRDALGKRIQMETKSVTIWFQNKRQTDRKVALHKATRPHAVSGSIHTEGGKSRDEWTSKTSEINSVNPLKRTSSYASSVSSTSSTSSKSKRPSLDRVASQSQIRFIDKQTSIKNDMTFKRQGLGLQTIPTSSSSHHTSPLTSPLSPIHTSSALWSHMLSSPIAPSSPPPVELVAYSRTRKTRTLDWACTVARLSSKEDGFPTGSLDSTLKPAFDISKQDVAMSEREYEEAIATTEDEEELITPQASQSTLVSWPNKGQRRVTVTQGKDNAEDKVLALPATRKTNGVHNLPENSPQIYPWQEDEMHAALALCGLRG